MACPCVFIIFQLGENPIERLSLVLRYPSAKIFCSSIELLPYCAHRFLLFSREGRVHEFFHVRRFTQKALQSKIASNYESHKNTSLRHDKYPLPRIGWKCFALSVLFSPCAEADPVGREQILRVNSKCRVLFMNCYTGTLSMVSKPVLYHIARCPAWQWRDGVVGFCWVL